MDLLRAFDGRRNGGIVVFSREIASTSHYRSLLGFQKQLAASNSMHEP